MFSFLAGGGLSVGLRSQSAPRDLSLARNLKARAFVIVIQKRSSEWEKYKVTSQFFVFYWKIEHLQLKSSLRNLPKSLFVDKGLFLSKSFENRGKLSDRISSKMATRRYSIVGRGRPPLSAHSQEVNSINRKPLSSDKYSLHLAKTPTSPTLKGAKSVLCTPDVYYTKERSLCQVARPQVSWIFECRLFVLNPQHKIYRSYVIPRLFFHNVIL